jgi:hypothetical protein
VWINPYQVIERQEISKQLASERSSAIAKQRQEVVTGSNWCWD